MIELKNIRKIYNKGKHNEFHALNGVDLTINEGEFVAITGTSGAGKSTLFYVISGIDTYEAGSCLVDEKELKKMSGNKLAELRNQTFGFVMQDYALVEEFSVIDNVLLTLYFSKVRKNRKKIAMDALKRVGISDLANKTVKELSGGQKQRVAIARAVVNKPKYLLADEPTGALDSENTKNVMDLFIKLNQEGQTIVLITHDLTVANYCNRIVKMEDGRVISDMESL